VLGATGQVGKNVILHLIASDKVEVLAAARSPEKAKEQGVPVVYLDLDKLESIAPALEGIDRAFRATGYSIDMMRQRKDFLNIAKKAGVKHIVHLGACGDNDTRVAHYAWHQFIERYIEWCGFSFNKWDAVKPDEVFDNLPAIIGRKPRTWADFVKKHGHKFRYQSTEKIG
jgi:NAD(P)H dehydrogenase (quinone)